MFECLPLFLLSLFWPPPFSISLSLSLSCSCPFFFFAFFWFLAFVSFFPFLSSLLLFHERNSIKILNCKVLLHQYFLFFWLPVLLFFKSLSLIFAFLSMFSVSKNPSWNTPIFGQKGCCNKTVFLWTCVLQNVKSYRFLAIFLGKFWLMFKKTL